MKEQDRGGEMKRERMCRKLFEFLEWKGFILWNLFHSLYVKMPFHGSEGRQVRLLRNSKVLVGVKVLR